MAEPGERGADLTLQVVVALEQDYRQQFIAHPGADEPGVRVQSAARAVLIGRRLFLSVGRAFRLLTEPGSGHVLDVEPEQREQQVQRFRVEEVVEHTLLRGVDLRREPCQLADRAAFAETGELAGGALSAPGEFQQLAARSFMRRDQARGGRQPVIRFAPRRTRAGTPTASARPRRHSEPGFTRLSA
ncbi:MAG: hypothetical protein MAG453_01234 [Calditrichaeota bacterium]|nr:hypothetical protein [Calditrichota bacterium]